MAVIQIEGLRKEYRRLRGPATLALDGLDLSVPEGGVFGFLGPNGAGKTTTIRCLLGLVRPSAGGCRLLGAETTSELHRVIARVGSIVETPALYPRFSARRNLELLGRLHGIGPSRVALVLDRVGLSGRSDDQVKTYSLGMRQRLGIAAALLSDPEVLILDEPANGLDPAGIKKVRDLLRSLGAEGRTVFVSSHILSEIQQMADRVAILSHGRCVTAGAVQEVLATGRTGAFLVRVAERERAVQILIAAGLEAMLDGDAIRVALPVEPSTITRSLAEHQLYVSELRPEQVDLETVFLELTGGAIG